MRIVASNLTNINTRPNKSQFVQNYEPVSNFSLPQKIFISFKAGNKAQAIEWCVENKPYFQNGGVATAISDRRCLRVSEADPIITEARRKNIIIEPLNSKAFAMPMYNGSLKYSTDGILEKVEVPKIPTGLPENSPFKKYILKSHSVRAIKTLSASTHLSTSLKCDFFKFQNY